MEEYFAYSSLTGRLHGEGARIGGTTKEATIFISDNPSIIGLINHNVEGVLMTKKEDIKVIVVNPPTKEQAEKRIKELCEHLAKNWHSLNPKKLEKQ